MLAVAIAADDHPAAGLDLLDQPLVAAGPPGRNQTRSPTVDHVPALDRQALEQPPDVAGEGPPVVGLDDREQAVDPDDPPRQAGRGSTDRRDAASSGASLGRLAGCLVVHVGS